MRTDSVKIIAFCAAPSFAISPKPVCKAFNNALSLLSPTKLSVKRIKPSISRISLSNALRFNVPPVSGVSSPASKSSSFTPSSANNSSTTASSEESSPVFFNDNKRSKIARKVPSTACGLEANNLRKINAVKCLCCFGKA